MTTYTLPAKEPLSSSEGAKSADSLMKLYNMLIDMNRLCGKMVRRKSKIHVRLRISELTHAYARLPSLTLRGYLTE